jgi:hypothetical protein
MNALEDRLCLCACPARVIGKKAASAETCSFRSFTDALYFFTTDNTVLTDRRARFLIGNDRLSITDCVKRTSAYRSPIFVI